jgi:hypothetical protein
VSVVRRLKRKGPSRSRPRRRKAAGPDHRFEKRPHSSWFSPTGADTFVDQPSSLTVLRKVDGAVHDLGSEIASILFDQAAKKGAGQ